jgi:hypothetical protein
MGAVNITRVLLGGLVAGLVFNVGEAILNSVILADTMTEMTARHNMREMDGADIGLFILLSFVIAIIMIWLYAAVRPRLGAGPGTATRIAIALWFPAYCVPSISWSVFGFISPSMSAFICAWGLAEYILAALAGSVIYRDSQPPG